MKRTISLMLAVMLCISLCACGSAGAPQIPTESEEWTITSQYVAGKIAEFTATETYQNMVDDFVEAFTDVNAKLIVRRPYLVAAIEYYLDDPQCHLLILALRGDFCVPDSYDTRLTLIYDMESGVFYDRLNQSVPEAAEKYAAIEGSAAAGILGRPHETFYELPGNEPLWTQFELYKFLTEEEVAAVNTALGVEEPSDEIQYEQLPTEPLEIPDAEPENEAVPDMDEMPEEEAQEAETDDEQPEEDAIEQPKTVNGVLSVDNQFLIDAARNIQSSKHYQEYAEDSSTIQVKAAYEYRLENFEGFDVHLIMLRVGGIDTDMHGFSANVFLVDPATGEVYSEFNVDLNAEWNFQSVEDTYAPILSSSFWMDPSVIIWSDVEQITQIPQEDLTAINNALT